ncbi:MAG: hypothetical protein ACOX7U_00615 [Desulfitobacteriia bacterium]|jgi:hypothetical protein
MKTVNTGSDQQLKPARQFCSAFGKGDKRIEVAAMCCGRDVAVTVVGGIKHHIGAVALAVPRPSLKDPSEISASASVICVTGHKDDELARDIALKFSSTLNCIASVSVGIHIDQAQEEEIGILIHNSECAVNSLINQLRKNNY